MIMVSCNGLVLTGHLHLRSPVYDCSHPVSHSALIQASIGPLQRRDGQPKTWADTQRACWFEECSVTRWFTLYTVYTRTLYASKILQNVLIYLLYECMSIFYFLFDVAIRFELIAVDVTNYFQLCKVWPCNTVVLNKCEWENCFWILEFERSANWLHFVLRW